MSSNLIVGSRFRDRLVEITIFFFKKVSIDLLNGIGRVGSTPAGFPVLTQHYEIDKLQGRRI
ncbi:MAG TPA: hypothetical protein VE573_07925 [Nitrososphaeraceae archaeon]|nr:hypothetical protein [Nitrososphaeraceae archaeon]